MSTSPRLSLRSLVLARGTAQPIDAALGAGVHLVVGPNGVGKTSLLHCIAGTLPPRSGAVELDGKSLAQGSDRVVMAPNSPPDIAWIRAGLLLEFVASLYPATRRDAAAAAHIVAAFGIDPFLGAPLGTLSAGTARKLMLAAALIAAPPVMLFDEPTNEIDAASVSAFVNLVAEAAVTRIAIVTTHHAADLAALRGDVIELA